MSWKFCLFLNMVSMAACTSGKKDKHPSTPPVTENDSTGGDTDKAGDQQSGENTPEGKTPGDPIAPFDLDKELAAMGNACSDEPMKMALFGLMIGDSGAPTPGLGDIVSVNDFGPLLSPGQSHNSVRRDGAWKGALATASYFSARWPMKYSVIRVRNGTSKLINTCKALTANLGKTSAMNGQDTVYRSMGLVHDVSAAELSEKSNMESLLKDGRFNLEAPLFRQGAEVASKTSLSLASYSSTGAIISRRSFPVVMRCERPNKIKAYVTQVSHKMLEDEKYDPAFCIHVGGADEGDREDVRHNQCLGLKAEHSMADCAFYAPAVVMTDDAGTEFKMSLGGTFKIEAAKTEEIKAPIYELVIDKIRVE